MKSWKSSSLPVHATPMKLTWSANWAATSSTEGASRLQVLQVGAQNQNAVGTPATAAPSKVPPPTRGALNWRMSGTTTASVPADAASSSAGGAPGTVLAPLDDVAASEPASPVSPTAGADVTESAESSESADPQAASNRASAAAAGAIRRGRFLGPVLTVRTVVTGAMPRAAAPPSFRNCHNVTRHAVTLVADAGVAVVVVVVVEEVVDEVAGVGEAGRRPR
jgi:hypothetical protein